MNIKLEQRVDLSDKKLFDYLVNPPHIHALDFVVVEPIPAAHQVDNIVKRPLTVVPYALKFGVLETWRIAVNGTTAFDKKIPVIKAVEVELLANSRLLIIGNPPKSDITEAHRLYSLYDPIVHGDDIETWINSVIAPGVDRNSFAIDVELTIRKLAEPKDFDARARQNLFDIYSGSPSDIRIKHKFANETSLWEFVGKERFTKSLISQVPLEEFEEKPSPLSRETDGRIPADVAGEILNDWASQAIPFDCGKQRRYNESFMTVPGLPEFKAEKVFVRVKVGCVEVVFWVPVLRFRTTEIQGWYMISLPRDVAQYVWELALTCAKRATLSGAVVGLILGSVEAAGFTFNATFKSCVVDELIRCANGSVSVVKLVGPWK